jgi:predicted nucleotidyltransferase
MLSNAMKELLIKRTKQLCGKRTIYLFGSHAYGTPDFSSDIDIAAIMDHVESNVALAAALWDVLKDIPFPKDIIVASKDEFDFYRKEAGSLLKTIAEKGEILYAG